MNRTRLICFASAFLVLGPQHAHAIGVARIEIGYPEIEINLRTGSAAQISDRHIITAAHLFDLPPDGQLDTFPFEEFLRFSVTFEAAGGPTTITFSKTNVRIMPD